MSHEEEMVQKKRGLGRGLSALFEDEEADFSETHNNQPKAEAETSPSNRKLISVAQLRPGIFQPRHKFNNESIEELASSIRQHGLLQPILVRPLKDDGQYEIVAGERRWRAAQKAQLHEVPVIIRELDDESTLEIALIENLQREDLNAIDEARGLQQLADDFDYSAEKIAEMLGKSRSYVANMLRLMDLTPPVMALVSDGKLSAGHARSLLGLDETAQEEMAKKSIALGLSVRQLEKMAQEAKGKPSKNKIKKLANAINSSEKDVNTLALEREISNLLGMSVDIDMADDQAGRISIIFKSLDQLDEVLHRLSHNPGRLAIRG